MLHLFLAFLLSCMRSEVRDLYDMFYCSYCMETIHESKAKAHVKLCSASEGVQNVSMPAEDEMPSFLAL